MHLGNIVAMMRALAFVHQDTFEVVPQVLLATRRVLREIFSHVKLKWVGNAALRFATGQIVVIEDKANDGKMEHL